jgi:hypothetical protein
MRRARPGVPSSRTTSPAAVGLACVIVLLASLFRAEEARAQFGAVGVKGGINWTDLSGDTPTDGGSGFVGGIYASGQSDLIVAQLEVLLSKRSFTELGLTPSAGTVEFKETLIQIPLLFGARAGGGPLAAMPYLGPSLLLKSSCNVNQGGLDAGCRSVPGFEENSTLWSLLFGLALDYRLGRAMLTLDGRYDLGLSDVFASREGKWRGFALMFGIGYLMRT